MRKLLLILAIASLGQAPAVKGGTVTGSAIAVQNAKAMKLDELYVYLEPTARASNSVGKGVVAEIVQKSGSDGPEFIPHVVVIPKGAKVFFPNRDQEEHNVFSPAVKANDWFGFDLGRYGPDKKGRARTFLQTGEFDIYCDIHKGMWAKIKVVPSRYFTRVVDGKFTFTDVPPGTYRVVAWAADSREDTTVQPFEVVAGQTKQVEDLRVQYRSSSHVHPRLDGSEYGPYPTR